MFTLPDGDSARELASVGARVEDHNREEGVRISSRMGANPSEKRKQGLQCGIGGIVNPTIGLHRVLLFEMGKRSTRQIVKYRVNPAVHLAARSTLSWVRSDLVPEAGILEDSSCLDP
jgi:hypothetical protein